MKRTLMTGIAMISLAGMTTACVTDPNTGEQKIARTGIGAVVGGTLGYLLGDVVGGKTARIVGAGIGGTAGAVIGKQFDNQIKELDEQTAGSGVDVEELGDQEAILVRLPDGVTFATGSSTINAGFQTTLDTVAQSLIKYPNSLIDVYGFTDTTGSTALNQQLSVQRAEAVANYLVSRGVSRARIATQGYGEQYEYLRVKTGDNINEPLNRRVEIKITPISQEDVNAAR